MMTPVTLHASTFKEWVHNSPRVLIVTHVNPDGDAIGSALAMGNLIESLGSQSTICCHHAVPNYLRFVPGADRIQIAAESEPYDLAIVVDLNVEDRMGSLQDAVHHAKRRILIDHHQDPKVAADLQIVITEASATAQIIYHLYQALGIALTPEVSTQLMLGIVTDTGSFRYPNTTTDSLHVAANLLEHQGNLAQISEEVYARRPFASLILMKSMLNSLQMTLGGKVAIAVIGPEDFQAAGATDELTEGLSSLLMSVDTVQVAALLRQEPGKKIRTSLRSRAPIDVSVVAQQFGGGGHRNASGCTFDDDLIGSAKKVQAALEACLAS